MKTKSPATVLNALLLDSSDGLCESPWFHQHLSSVGSQLAENLARRFDADEEDVYNELVESTEAVFLGGIDFCLELQRALRAFADGDGEALRPFIPNPILDTKRRPTRGAKEAVK